MTQRQLKKPVVRRVRRVRRHHRAPDTIILPYGDVLLRTWEVSWRTGLSEKVLSRLMEANLFPRYHLVGATRVLLQSQVDGWIATRMRVRDSMPYLKATPTFLAWTPEMASAREGLPTGMRVLRMADVEKRFSRSAGWVYWIMSRDPGFPRPIPITLTTRGWVAHEVENWLDSHFLRRAA